MAHPGGRPTEYSEEKLLKTKEYLSLCKDTQEQIGEKIVLGVKLPTIEGLADYLDVNKTTIYEWESKFPEFSNVIDKLRNKQADRLVNNGLAGTYNPTIAKVLLTKHGYRDAVDTDVTSKGEQINITDPKALALAKEFEDKLKKEL